MNAIADFQDEVGRAIGDLKFQEVKSQDLQKNTQQRVMLLVNLCVTQQTRSLLYQVIPARKNYKEHHQRSNSAKVMLPKRWLNSVMIGLNIVGLSLPSRTLSALQH